MNIDLRKNRIMDVVSLFYYNKELVFSDIEQKLHLRSNHLAYYLKMLVSQGVLEKKETQYRLTKAAETLLPYLQQLNGKERIKLSVLVLAISDKAGKYAFIKREKRPYQNYLALPGGKIQMEETWAEAAHRIARQEIGSAIHHMQLRSVVDEHLREDGHIKNSWFLFLVTAKSIDPGRAAWSSL